MKTSILTTLCLLILFACQVAKQEPVSAETSVNSSDLSDKLLRELENEVRTHGLPILFGYYAMGIGDEEIIDQLHVDLEYDLYYLLNDPKTEAQKKEKLFRIISTELQGLSRNYRVIMKEKALEWLRISQLVNSAFYGVSMEVFLEEASSVPALAAIINRDINPEIGQSVLSLSSAQTGEIHLEIWDYLANVDKSTQLQSISALSLAFANLTK